MLDRRPHVGRTLEGNDQKRVPRPRPRHAAAIAPAASAGGGTTTTGDAPPSRNAETPRAMTVMPPIGRISLGRPIR